MADPGQQMTESRLEQQEAALLRLARLLAGETDQEKLLHRVLVEAVSLVGGSRGHLRRWNPDRQRLVVGARVPEGSLVYEDLTLGQGLSGQVALGTRPILLDHNSGHNHPSLKGVGVLMGAAVAVALRLDTRLLGTLLVATDRPDARFTQEDAQAVMVLGSLATAALIGQDRARLGGALLAARTAAHELNNQLALTVGYSEMVARQPELSPRTQEMAREALRGAREAAATVVHLQQVTRLEETEMGAPSGAILDLARSTAKAGEG